MLPAEREKFLFAFENKLFEQAQFCQLHLIFRRIRRCLSLHSLQ